MGEGGYIVPRVETGHGLRARGRPAFRGVAERLGDGLVLVWAGLSLGVAFVATPAKFLAPSLSLPAALDVGRQTFRVYNRIELAMVVALAMLALAAGASRRRYLALAVPVLVVAAQALWLIPALDARAGAIIGGASRLADSHLHVADIVAEAIKAMWLLGLGFIGSGARRWP